VEIRQTGSGINFQHDPNGKNDKTEHNSGPVHRRFNFFAARVGLSWSGISIFKGGCHGNEILGLHR